jgi:hypothetical protein
MCPSPDASDYHPDDISDADYSHSRAIRMMVAADDDAESDFTGLSGLPQRLCPEEREWESRFKRLQRRAPIAANVERN